MREFWIVLLVAMLSVGGIAAMNWAMGPPGGSGALHAPATLAGSSGRS
jgi:hypothetical protein